mgnify:CR=1 FL=1
MKNAKRILALIAAVLLFGMYLSTLIFALIGSPHSIDLLWASVACTIVLPVLLYVFRLTQHDIPSDDPTDSLHRHIPDNASKSSSSHDHASDDTM